LASPIARLIDGLSRAGIEVGQKSSLRSRHSRAGGLRRAVEQAKGQLDYLKEKTPGEHARLSRKSVVADRGVRKIEGGLAPFCFRLAPFDHGDDLAARGAAVLDELTGRPVGSSGGRPRKCRRSGFCSAAGVRVPKCFRQSALRRNTGKIPAPSAGWLKIADGRSGIVSEASGGRLTTCISAGELTAASAVRQHCGSATQALTQPPADVTGRGSRKPSDSLPTTIFEGSVTVSTAGARASTKLGHRLHGGLAKSKRASLQSKALVMKPTQTAAATETTICPTMFCTLRDRSPDHP